MADQQVMTLDNPAGLLLTPEILQKIGVGTGDQIEITVDDCTLTVRPLNEAGTERKNIDPKTAIEATVDGPTATIRELIKETLVAEGISEATGVEVTLADGQRLLFLSADDPQLDEVVKRADIRDVKPKQSAKASGMTMDELEDEAIANYLVKKNDELYRRLA